MILTTFGFINIVLIGLLTSIVSVSNHTKCMLLSNQIKAIYVLTNTVKNFTTIHLQLN